MSAARRPGTGARAPRHPLPRRRAVARRRPRRAAHQASAVGAHRQAVRHVEAVLRHAPGLSRRAPCRPDHDPDPLALPPEPLRRLAGGVQAGGGDVRPAGRPGPLARSLIAHARTSLWAVGPESRSEAIERALVGARRRRRLELRAIAHADLARCRRRAGHRRIRAQGQPRGRARTPSARCAGRRAGRAARAAWLRPHVPRQRPAGDRRGAGRTTWRTPSGSSGRSRGTDLRSGPGQRVRRGVSIGSVRPGGAVRRARPPAGEGHRVLLRRVPPRAHAGLRPRQPRQWREAESELRSLLSSDGEPGIMESFARCLLARVWRGAATTRARRSWWRWRVRRHRSNERRLVGPVAIAAVETDAGSRERPPTSSSWPSRRWPAGWARPTTRSPPSSPATCSGPAWTGPGAAAPEPWATGLRGDWRPPPPSGGTGASPTRRRSS